ncbi:MAG: hypothetical protein IPN86_10670 [Saprospiraceae bacterium]|nr:hypothetical protein [Saprospiraceae bacterium]
MRIIGEFDLDQIKVTVFVMNERLSVKYENNLLEQTYKFRDGSGIRTVEDVKKYSEGETIKEIKLAFEKMGTIRLHGIQNLNIDSDTDKFDEII